MTASAPQCATGCGRPAPSALLCPGCVTGLRGALELAATIEGDLDDAIARLLRHGGGGRRAGSEPPLPVDLAASQAAGRLRWALFRAVSYVTPGAGAAGASSITWAARHLAARVALVARHPMALEMHDTIRAAVGRCVMVLDGPPERTYAGPCPECGTDLLGVPGAAVVTCARCGAQAELAERQQAMRAAMEDMLGGAAWCARMAGRLGAEVSESTLYSWARRCQLVPHSRQPSGRGGEPVPFYRLGDVLELAARNPRKARA